MKYYLYTCIWRDYYERRGDFLRPLGEWALSLLKKILKKEDSILYSDMVIAELRIAFSDAQIKELFGIIHEKNLLVKVTIDEEDAKHAELLYRRRKLPYGDALHSVLAKRHHAILVTRDRHFDAVKDMLTIKKPEELL
jgi:predicted nucleic acid-binding protein